MANAVTKSSVCPIMTSSILISNLIFGAKTLSKSGSPHPTQYTWLAYVLVEKQQDFLSIDTLSSVMTIIPCWHAKPNLKNHRVRTFYFYFLNNLCKSSDILKAGKLVELWLCQSLMKDIFASELSCSKLKKEVGKLTKKLTNQPTGKLANMTKWRSVTML